MFVYKLYNNDSLVYVGVTKDLYKRFEHHGKDKVFDNARYITIEDRVYAEKLESYLITTLKPPMNKCVSRTGFDSMCFDEYTDDTRWQRICDLSGFLNPRALSVTKNNDGCVPVYTSVIQSKKVVNTSTGVERTLSSEDKILYCYMLCMYKEYSSKGRLFCETQQTIADEVGVEVKTVNRGIKKLCDVGAVSKVSKFMKTPYGKVKTTCYAVRDVVDEELCFVPRYEDEFTNEPF